MIAIKAKRATVLALCAMLSLSQLHIPGHAQGRFGEEELVRLSRILGGVHYLRSKCSRSERQVWRERMRNLLEIEQPSQLLENKMVAEFNSGYKQQERKHSRCNRDAKNEAKRLALEGQGLINQMVQAIN